MTKSHKIKHLLIDFNAESVGGSLFDQKTAPRHKLLIFNCIFIDFKKPDGDFPYKPFPFWKQLNKK